MIMVRMTDELRSSVDSAASRFGLTVTGLTHMAVRYYLHEIQRTGALLTADSKRGSEI